MKILSIDVGIKNLAFCLLETEKGCDSANKFKILKWDTINLLDEKKCYECGKPAKFTKNNIDYCRKHAKNSEFFIPSQRDINIKRLSLPDIYEYIKSNDISLNIFEQPRKNIRRTLIIEELEKYNATKFLDPIKTDNAGIVSLIEIGINLQRELDKLLTDIDNSNPDGEKIHTILIENQLSNIAIRMKTLQGMITQYFIMKGYKNIEYVCSQNKLRMFIEKDKNRERVSGEKTSYSERKRLGIKYCQEVLDKANMEMWIEFMKKHNKRDDLADSFLQGLWWIQK